MITLYGFGRAFGLPDPSPFVGKAEVLLKLSGLPYQINTDGFGKAPKGKLPYILDGGTMVADSTFIRMHLEDKHGVDFEKGLNADDKALAWALERMCEEHLYWAVVQERWMDDANFARGPRRFFDKAPALIRPLVITIIRRQVRRNLKGHGMGRHTNEEIARLAAKDITSIAAILGQKNWLMGDAPCGADATVFAFVAGCLCPHFQGPIRRAAESHANLIAYRDRGMAKWFPELAHG